MSRTREVSKMLSNNFSSSAPNSPFTGQIWTDTTNANSPTLKVYNGTEWKIVSGASSGGGGGMATVLMTLGAS